MNRAFLIILAPGLLVALLYLGYGWSFQLSMGLGAGLLAVAAGALLIRGRKRAGN